MAAALDIAPRNHTNERTFARSSLARRRSATRTVARASPLNDMGAANPMRAGGRTARDAGYALSWSAASARHSGAPQEPALVTPELAIRDRREVAHMPVAILTDQQGPTRRRPTSSWAPATKPGPPGGSSVGSFSDEIGGIAPRASLTERARAEICRRVGADDHFVTQVAASFGVGWHTAMAAVRDHGRPLGTMLEVAVFVVVWSAARPAERSSGFLKGVG